MELKHEVIKVASPLSFWIYCHQGKSDSHFAAHWHQALELSYTLRGKIDNFKIGEHQFHPQTGDILVVNPGVIHSIDTQSHLDDCALSIMVPYPYLERFYPAISQKEIIINNPEDFSEFQQTCYIHLQSLLQEITTLYLGDSSTKWLRIETLINSCLLILLENFTINRPNKINHNQYQLSRLHIITKYINDNYQAEIHLNDVALAANVSREYLARFFKKNMEMTIGQYLNNVRAQHAYEQISNLSLNLSDIASQNGFSGIRTMNRAFDNLYHKSASKIRQEIKE